MDRALLARDIDAIDEYRLIAELGRGGMATVYLACLDGPFGLQKLVVVKVLRHEPSGESPALGQMFLDEARLSAQMRHPNVVQTLEAGQSQDGRLFLVMEYLEGQALSALLRRTSQSHEFWPLAAHVRVLAEMLRGLHYAHELAGLDGTPLGVVHRDVSPQNVFVTYDGAIKLTDFGIAKVTAAESQTQVGVLKGKVAYMAPEQVAGAPLDRRADIFAVGVMLFEALCGKRFWQGQSETAIFRRLLTGRLPDVHEAAPHAPESLRAICARALAVDPAERFETAAGVQHELERWLDTSSRGATPAQVGRVAATLFRHERDEVRQVIERTLVPAPGARWTTPSRPPVSGVRSVPPTQGLATDDAGPLGAEPLPLASVAEAGPHPLSAGRISVSPTVAAAAALAAGGICIAAALLWHKPPSSSEGRATGDRPHADVASSVSLSARASPSAVVWYLDGVALPTNPVTMAIARSDQVRHLRAETPEGGVWERDFVPARDVGFDVALEAAAIAAPAPEGVSSAGREPAFREPALREPRRDLPPGVSGPRAAGRGARALRPLDMTNPYGP